MSRVPKQSFALASLRALRQAVAPVLLSAILAAGPVFFAYALFVAFYQELPADARVAKFVTPAPTLDQPTGKGELLSPLVNRDAAPPAAALAQGQFAGETPLMVYRRLRMTATAGEVPEEQGDEASAIEANPGAASATRAYRTVCVRLCDGFFFPIGRAVSTSALNNHATLCTSRCAAPARLFVYPEVGGSPEVMRDLEGRPYMSLKTAFGYQKAVNPECGCRPQPWSMAAQELHRRYAAATAPDRATARQMIAAVSQKPLLLAPVPDAPSIASRPTVREATAVIAPVRDLTEKPGGNLIVATNGALPRQMPKLIADKIERATLLAGLDLPFPVTDNVGTGRLVAGATSSVQPYVITLASLAGTLPAQASGVAFNPPPVQVAGWRRSDRYRHGLSADQILRHNIEQQF